MSDECRGVGAKAPPAESYRVAGPGGNASVRDGHRGCRVRKRRRRPCSWIACRLRHPCRAAAGALARAVFV